MPTRWTYIKTTIQILSRQGRLISMAHFSNKAIKSALQKTKSLRQSAKISLTVIKVEHTRVFGQTRVKIGHERGDVLSGCEHSVDYISSVNETCERKTCRGYHPSFSCDKRFVSSYVLCAHRLLHFLLYFCRLI